MKKLLNRFFCLIGYHRFNDDSWIESKEYLDDIVISEENSCLDCLEKVKRFKKFK